MRGLAGVAAKGRKTCHGLPIRLSGYALARIMHILGQPQRVEEHKTMRRDDFCRFTVTCQRKQTASCEPGRGWKGWRRPWTSDRTDRIDAGMVPNSGLVPLPAARSAPFRRAGEVEAELLFLGEAHEVPLVGEGALIPMFQMVEDGAVREADAERLLEQVHQLLVGQSVRERLRGSSSARAPGSPGSSWRVPAAAATAWCVRAVGRCRVPQRGS